MRAEELVGRADEHVDAPVRDVDRPVRAVVDGVGPGQRARVVCELDDAPNVGERADCVGCDGERDDARAVGELPLEVVEIERRVVVDVDEADREVLVVGELEPRRHVRVVVELGDEDLVALAPVASGGARQRERERRHVRAEDRLLGTAAEELAGLQSRLGDERLGAAARLVRSADVGVRLPVVAGDGVDDLVGNLRAAGPVEEGQRLA